MLHSENLENPSHEYIEPASESFVKEVIRIATERFVDGLSYNRELRKKIETNPMMGASFRSLALEERFLSKKDEPFLNNAARIPGTNFVASAGPTQYTLKNFFMDTVFNATLPIHQVVALGSSTAEKDGTYQDFHNYCLTKKELKCEPLHATVEHVEGVTTKTLSGHQTFPYGIVHSQLAIASDSTRQSFQPLKVTIFRLDDNTPLNLTSFQHPNELEALDKQAEELINDKMEAMWQLYKKSLTNTILVHCAAGVGRTGHYLLSMGIFHHYSRIFSANTPEDAADEIHKLLNAMREVRPALVAVEEQFEDAIANAASLYRYALEKNYIQVGTPCREIEVPKKKDRTRYKDGHDPKIFGNSGKGKSDQKPRPPILANDSGSCRIS